MARSPAFARGTDHELRAGMAYGAGRRVTLLHWRASTRGVALLAAALLVQTTSGCISNEYRIKKDELQRLAELPPDQRGASVRIGQKLGSRRGDAVEAPTAFQSTTVVQPDAYVDVPDPGTGVNLDINVGGGGRVSSSNGPPPSGGFRTTAPGGLRATPPSPAPATGGFHGTPTVSSGGLRATPPAPSGGAHPPSGGGGGGLNFLGGGGGGGGGGNGGDALVLLAVVVIVGAAVATIALAASEGMLYEGHAEMSPDQVLHLEGPYGGHDVRLSELTPAEAAAADQALVMDDEGYGLRRLDSAPLDRTGGVFRFELGAGSFNVGQLRASGFSSHVGMGYFPVPRLGILVDLGLGFGSPDPSCCVGPVTSDAISRHSLGLELQVLPLSLGPLHLGAFAGGGVVLAGRSGADETGPMGSAGALLELELTSHMALAVRGGASTASLPSGWSSAGTVTGGLAIY
jgi:hypothetical protein